MGKVQKNLRENDKFYFGEGSSPVSDIIKTIAKEMTSKAGVDYQWKIQEPTSVDDVKHEVIMSTTTTFGEVFYLRMWRDNKVIPSPEPTTDKYTLTSVNVQIGRTFNLETKKLDDTITSVPAKLSWYYDDIDPSIGTWLPITYWLNVTKDAVNLVLRGDPSGDTYPYTKYLTSYMYVGSLSKIEEDQVADKEGNFGLTVTSDVLPPLTTKFGPRTGSGVTDIVMYKTKSGMPYQPHYPSFYTGNPYSDKLKIEGSRWNNQKHQFSDVTLFHPIDMERGKMQNVLVGDDGSLYDNDKLVYKQRYINQETYRKFTITAPYNFINNSANPHFCVAIRCYNDDETVTVEDPSSSDV